MARSPTRVKTVPRWRRALVIGFRVAIALGVLGLIALVTTVYVTASELPSFDQLKSSPNGQMIRVHAADGTVIVSLGPSYGEWLNYDQIPTVMREAIVSTEDRRFYSHIGVDPVGLARAAKFAWMHRGTDRRLQGASTITQQVARTIFLSNRYSFRRKLHEAILALALERKFSKDQILDLYLNKVYFGGGAYGIDAASRKFFGHSATHLSLSEAAVIAGLVKAPSEYSPTADAQAAVDRAGVVIQLMRENGVITAQQAENADPAAVKLAPEPKQNSVRYFTDWALPQLDTLIDERQRPLEVWTTLDLNMQRDATKAINENVPAGAQGALVALDRDGAVRAMVGGKDYVSSIYNRATTAVRQPGSAWKLFVYLAALEAGYKPGDTVVDEPVTIQGWSPRNDSRHFSGAMSLRTAFAYSVNTIAAKIGAQVGFDTIADMARRFGITTPIDTHPAMVLGTSDVRLIDMTQAFAAIANKGVAVQPYGIVKVTANGETIYQHETDQSHVLVAPYIAAEMTDLLQTTVNTGTGRAAQIGRPVAGKTGTTSLNRDGWFLGFSSGLTTGIWMGRDDAKPIPGLFGGRGPARAFADFMKPALADRPVEQFDTQVTLPDWQDNGDEENYFGQPDNGLFVDPDGNPIPPDQFGQPNSGIPGAGQPDAPVDDTRSNDRLYPPGRYPPAAPTDQSYPDDRAAPRAAPRALNQSPYTETPPPADRAPQRPERLDQDWMNRVLGRTPRTDRPPQARPAPAPSPTPRPGPQDPSAFPNQ